MALVVGTNSYLSVAEATSILSDRANSNAWAAAGPVTQSKALVSATRVIDERAWIGSAVSASQSLSWPRKGAVFIDPKLNLQITVAEDETPERVKVAAAELALHFIQFPNAYATSESVAESITVGPISISDSNTKSKTVKVPSNVWDQLKPLMLRNPSSHFWWRAN